MRLNHLQSRRSRSAALPLLALCAALLSATLSGCGEEAEPREPTARMVMLHTASVLGEVVFQINGEVVARLTPGAITEPVNLPVGVVDVSIRNPGATTDLIFDRIDLQAQPYLVAVVGQSLEELRFWKVDEPAPGLDPGEAALKVVNLDSEGYTYDIYMEDDQGIRRPLVEGLAYGRDSKFTEMSLPTTAVGTAQSLPVRLLGFDIGDNPQGRPEMSAELTLVDGVPYMVLIQNDPRSNMPAFSIITAD